MPLPDAFFEPTSQETWSEYSVQEPFAPDPNLSVPPVYLDGSGRVPINGFIRRKVIIKRWYEKVPAPAAVMVHSNGCVLYRVKLRCEETAFDYLVTGPDSVLVRTFVIAHYSQYRFAYDCNGSVTLAPWAERPDLSMTSDGSFEASRDLFRRMGDPPATPPPRVGDPVNPAGPGTGIPYVEFPNEALRPIAEQGYNTPYPEGNYSVLKETIWVREPGPVQFRDCVCSVTYRAAVRTTRWHLITGQEATAPNTIFVTPPIRITVSFEIPGCR